MLVSCVTSLNLHNRFYLDSAQPIFFKLNGLSPNLQFNVNSVLNLVNQDLSLQASICNMNLKKNN